MGIIFLDIDGVICLRSSDYLYFDPECLKRLQHVLEVTGANIVVSSSWKVGETVESLRDIFKYCGDRFCAYNGPIPFFDTTRIIDVTPSNCFNMDDKAHEDALWGRGLEIDTWLNKNQRSLNVKKYIIIDDEVSDLGIYKDLCLQSNTVEGITDNIAQEAIKRLGEA